LDIPPWRAPASRIVAEASDRSESGRNITAFVSDLRIGDANEARQRRVCRLKWNRFMFGHLIRGQGRKNQRGNQ